MESEAIFRSLLTRNAIPNPDGEPSRQSPKRVRVPLPESSGHEPTGLPIDLAVNQPGSAVMWI